MKNVDFSKEGHSLLMQIGIGFPDFGNPFPFWRKGHTVILLNIAECSVFTFCGLVYMGR